MKFSAPNQPAILTESLTLLKLAHAIQRFLEHNPLPASSGEFACMTLCPIGLAVTSLLPNQPAILTETLALLKLAHAIQSCHPLPASSGFACHISPDFAFTADWACVVTQAR